MPTQKSNSTKEGSDDDFVEELIPAEANSLTNISASPLVIQPKIDAVQSEEVVQVWRQLAANVFGFVKGIVDRYSTESTSLISNQPESYSFT